MLMSINIDVEFDNTRKVGIPYLSRIETKIHKNQRSTEATRRDQNVERKKGMGGGGKEKRWMVEMEIPRW